MTTKNVVISLFDYTGVMVRPWADAGYECHCYDIQHEGYTVRDGIHYHAADLSDIAVLDAIVDRFKGRTAIVFGFPPCTDLASSGARHWAKKAEADPRFQRKAIELASNVVWVASKLEAPYMLENPIGALCTQWDKPDHKFHPYEYGGYLPEDDVHPLWPNVIPERDAYTKTTCLWTGSGFKLPQAKPVQPIRITYANGKSGSPQWAKLGGSSQRTKNIRSATPRGFAMAVYYANAGVV